MNTSTGPNPHCSKAAGLLDPHVSPWILGHQIGVGGTATHFLTRRRQSPLAKAAGVGSFSYTRTALR